MKTWRLLRIDDGIDDNGSMFFLNILRVYIHRSLFYFFIGNI